MRAQLSPFSSWGMCWPRHLQHRNPRCTVPYGIAHVRVPIGAVTSPKREARHIDCAMCVLMCLSMYPAYPFEEDRASRRLGEISDGFSSCVLAVPLFSWGMCWPWHLQHIIPRCIAPYGIAHVRVPIGVRVTLARVPPYPGKRGTLIVQVACSCAS